jgi:hypothetical protein
MRVYCLSCPNEWLARAPSIPRQCPACWSRVLATEDELRIGALVCYLLTNLPSGKLPPLPPQDPAQGLADVTGLPFAIKCYHDVMGRTRDQSERRRAAMLMLQYRGLSSVKAQNTAQIMFP